MLSSHDTEYADNTGWLYDHVWRFWAESFGEPYLLNDHLVFFDGSILSCPFFPLSVGIPRIGPQHIEELLKARPEFANAFGLRLWGNLDLQPQTACQRFQCVRWLDCYSRDHDLAVELATFDYATNRSARLARNAAINAGVVGKTDKQEYLTAEQIRLLFDWVAERGIQRETAQIAAGIQGMLRAPDVYVVEARLARQLIGISVVVHLKSNIGVMLQSFGTRKYASRVVGDGLMAETIRFLQERRATRLHLGYSNSRGVYTFKEKWGASWKGPGYRYALLLREGADPSAGYPQFSPWRYRLGAGAGSHCY